MIKIRRSKKFKIAPQEQHWVNKIYRQVLEKDCDRIKFALDKGVISEKDAIDAICSQILEQQQKTLIRILFERRILYRRRYDFMLKRKFQNFKNAKKQNISRKNLYIGNMLVEYEVISREQVSKYLQIIHKMQQIGLGDSWIEFAEKTKLISEDVLNAILERVKEKLSRFEVKQNTIKSILRAQKIPFNFHTKLFIVTIIIGVFFFPVLLLSLASYTTLVGEPPQPKVDLTPKTHQQVTAPQKVTAQNHKIDHRSHLKNKQNQKWGKMFITQEQWQQLAKTYSPNTFPYQKPQLQSVKVYTQKDHLILGGLFQTLSMPQGLRMKIVARVTSWQSKQYKTYASTLDAQNRFQLQLENRLRSGYYEISLQINNNEQHPFTQKFINTKNQTWKVLLQVGSKKAIELHNKQEQQQILGYIELLKKTTTPANIKKVQHLMSNCNYYFIHKTSPFQNLQHLLTKNLSVISPKFLIDLYKIEIQLLQNSHSRPQKSYFKSLIINS